MAEQRHNCPRCGDAKKHFYVNTSTGEGYCHRCQYSTHNWDETNKALKLKKIKQVTFMDARLPVKRADLGTFKTLAVYCHSPQYIKYLLDRRITLEEMRAYNIQVAIPESNFMTEYPYNKLQGRLIIPLGEGTRHYQARTIEEGVEPKYWTSPGCNKSKLLFNLERIKDSPFVVVVEGPFDVLCTKFMRQHGVAILGKKISKYQIELLKGFEAYYVWLDKEAFGASVMTAYNIWVRYRRPTYVVNYQDMDDPGNSMVPELNCLLAQPVLPHIK